MRSASKPLAMALEWCARSWLALVADQRVADSRAKFAGNFVQLGFHPGFAVSVTLPGIIED
ncbi:MAG: hypothetical protein KGR48_15005 [Alphaproteobacteria bacterium]|nr:hypothetical protein [Alphaproteobacteria bacterium]